MQTNNMIIELLLMMMVSQKYGEGVDIAKTIKANEIKFRELDEHTLVTDSEVFPFVVAIMKKFTYISAGALVSENWVVTAADALYLLREAIRTLRVRLGSINNKKGGVLLSIKYFEIHPYFDDSSPLFDLALIKLSQAVRFTPSLRSIRLQNSMKEADATHFIVTSWPLPSANSEETEELKSMELIKRRRILSVTHLHPSDPEDCIEELTSIGINDTHSMMCLDTGAMMEPCMRDNGAPVVLNDILWGIVSSWRPSNCDNDLAGPSFVTLVSGPNISNWIHSVIKS